MTGRIKILITSGTILLVAAAFVLSSIVRRARPEFPPAYSYPWPSSPEDKGPQIVLWFDASYARVRNAIRIDVRGGVPHIRAEGSPIREVISYVNTEIDRNGAEWIVVTAASEEKIGDVMRVVDECRKTRIHGIALNYFADGWRR